MAGQDLRTKPPEARASNRPIAAAIRHARKLARLEQVEFAQALSARGCPANKAMVSRWELGADPKWETETSEGTGLVTIVPGYALLAAALVAEVTITELLRAVGVDQEEPLIRQVARIQRRQEMIEARLEEIAEMRADVDTWLVDRDELRSRTGMDRVGVPERLRRPESGSGS